jgi:hypothetical protein
MNNQIMRLAVEAGFLDGDLELFPETIERFAELVRRNERALAKPEQEPVAWMLPEYGDILPASQADGTGIYNIPLYTAPLRKEWVGLTDEQLSETYNDLYTQYKRDDVNIADFILIARTIEAQLKEKNT